MRGKTLFRTHRVLLPVSWDFLGFCSRGFVVLAFLSVCSCSHIMPANPQLYRKRRQRRKEKETLYSGHRGSYFTLPGFFWVFAALVWSLSCSFNLFFPLRSGPSSIKEKGERGKLLITRSLLLPVSWHFLGDLQSWFGRSCVSFHLLCFPFLPARK